MKNQNLNVDIDLTKIQQAIQSGAVKPNVYIDNQGVEHKTICLFVLECKNPTEQKTHNVKIKAHDSWNEVKDAEGKTIYFGKASPSRFQPKYEF